MKVHFYNKIQQLKTLKYLLLNFGRIPILLIFHGITFNVTNLVFVFKSIYQLGFKRSYSISHQLQRVSEQTMNGSKQTQETTMVFLWAKFLHFIVYE